MRKRACMIAFVAFVLSVALANMASADLVGWWKFDDGSGTVAADSSGNGYHGTVYDAVWVDGNLGGALEFAGAEYVDVPPEAWSTIETQATVCFWAYGDPDNQPQANFIFGAFQDPADNESRVMCAHVPWSSGTIYFDTGGVLGGPYDRINKDGDAADYEGTWTHWTLLKNADTGDQQIYINGELWHSGTGLTATMTGVTKFTIGTKPSLAEGWYYGMMDDFRLYDHAVAVEELADIMLGKGPGRELASVPTPDTEATDVVRDIVLSWEAGEFAATHDVYLGTVFDDVNDASRDNPLDVLVSQGQSDTTYVSPTVFEYGQTYYWRVDEVNAAPDNTIFKGETWSFTVEPVGYAVENVTATSNGSSVLGASLENMVNGSGLNENDEHSVDSGDMWAGEIPADEALWVQFEFDAVLKLYQALVWNYNVEFENMLGFGFKDVTVEYSADGVDWTVLGDFQFAQAASSGDYTANTTIDFAGAAVQYVRLIVNSTYSGGTRCGLSEVRFLSVPVNARGPEPADGATDVSVESALTWRSGRGAVSHEVYLGTEEDAVADGTALADVAADASYTPDDLLLETTYYWKVNEVNEAEAISTWEGSVWSFATEEFVVIDDFEGYNDEDNLIYETWIDGWVNGTGSVVGYFETPFTEQTIIHGGAQSMPLQYDGVSEADLTVTEFTDWAQAGITTLTIYFRGAVDNAAGDLYAEINGVKVTFDGDDETLNKLRWQVWNIDLASLGTNLANVSTFMLGIDSAGSGIIYVDDIRLYRVAPPTTDPVDPGTEGLVLEYTFDSDASDVSGNGYDGTLLGDARVQDGVLVLDGVRDALAVPRIGGDDATFGQMTYSMWMYSTENLESLDFSGGINTDAWAEGSIHMKFHYGLVNAGVYGQSDVEGVTLAEANVWHHVAMTVSDTQITAYLNGNAEASATLDEPLSTLVLGASSIGAWNNGGTLSRELTGQVDNVRIYDRALTEGEVLFLAGE